MAGGGNKGIHTISMDISLEWNVIERLELELASSDTAVQDVHHYATGSSKNIRWREKLAST